MIVMVSNQTNVEFGYLAGRYPGSVGHLYSPGGERGPFRFLPFALDNGAFVAFSKSIPWDEARWRRLLYWAAMCGQQPLWVLAPDVVQNREATIALWTQYASVVRGYGWRPAFAVQNGMTFSDVPDSECMLFIGGDDAFKDAAIGPWCDRFPGRVHVGRVNGFKRLLACYHAGAVSVDGTGWYHRESGQLAQLVKFVSETSTPAVASQEARGAA